MTSVSSVTPNIARRQNPLPRLCDRHGSIAHNVSSAVSIIAQYYPNAVITTRSLGLRHARWRRSRPRAVNLAFACTFAVISGGGERGGGGGKGGGGLVCIKLYLN